MRALSRSGIAEANALTSAIVGGSRSVSGTWAPADPGWVRSEHALSHGRIEDASEEHVGPPNGGGGPPGGQQTGAPGGHGRCVSCRVVGRPAPGGSDGSTGIHTKRWSWASGGRSSVASARSNPPASRAEHWAAARFPGLVLPGLCQPPRPTARFVSYAPTDRQRFEVGVADTTLPAARRQPLDVAAHVASAIRPSYAVSSNGDRTICGPGDFPAAETHRPARTSAMDAAGRVSVRWARGCGGAAVGLGDDPQPVVGAHRSCRAAAGDVRRGWGSTPARPASRRQRGSPQQTARAVLR